MARRNPVGRLTERDREILRWTGQGGVATLDQLARRFWLGAQTQTTMDRLRQLVKAGYIEVHFCDARCSGEQVFTLTEKGASLLEPALRKHLCTGLPPVAEIKQQLLAQDAYLKLVELTHEESSELVEWHPERQLRAGALRRYAKLRRGTLPLMSIEIPDAKAVVITRHGERETLYIEIDGAYYGKMLQHKASYLASLAGPGCRVIWVCTSDRVRQVQAVVAQYPSIEVLCV